MWAISEQDVTSRAGCNRAGSCPAAWGDGARYKTLGSLCTATLKHHNCVVQLNGTKSCMDLKLHSHQIQGPASTTLSFLPPAVTCNNSAHTHKHPLSQSLLAPFSPLPVVLLAFSLPSPSKDSPVHTRKHPPRKSKFPGTLQLPLSSAGKQLLKPWCYSPCPGDIFCHLLLHMHLHKTPKINTLCYSKSLFCFKALAFHRWDSENTASWN